MKEIDDLNKWILEIDLNEDSEKVGILEEISDKLTRLSIASQM